MIGDCVASACDFIRTRIIGHLSLADVNANEFLSDVTDGAAVRHKLVSVVVLQTGVKSTQALHCPEVFADDATACDLKNSGLTGLGIVFHVGWHLFGWCFSVAFHVYLSNAKVSPMVPAQRGKLMIHSSRIARLGNSGDSRRTKGRITEQR